MTQAVIFDSDSSSRVRSRFHAPDGPRQRVRADEIAVGDILPVRGEVISVLSSLTSSTPAIRLLVLRQADGGIDSTKYASGSTLEVIKTGHR